MDFDQVRYVEEYIKPKRKAHSLPDDLIDRYALRLPATDAEIAAQIRAVRSFWNSQTPGTSAHRVCKLCRTDDERLQAQHGSALLTAAWWTRYAKERRDTAQAATTEIADLLKGSYGALGVVTATVLDGFAAKYGLSPAGARNAATQADLTVVENRTLPQRPPIAQYPDLLINLQASGAKTIPELLHPGSGPFTLLDRYGCLADPALRLDAVAVENQLLAANRRGVSASDDALRAALNCMKSALTSGVDLAELALYHLVSVASDSVALGLQATRAELVKLGLEPSEAAVVTVLLADQQTAAGAVGLARVQALLSEGRLREARTAAQAIPPESGNRANAIKLVDAAKANLDDLLTEARRALEVPDELKAASLLREAAAISVEEAEDALTAVPLAPPSGLGLSSDGESVKLSWQPSTGHGDGTNYLIARSEQRAPATPAEGTTLARQVETTFDDPYSPVARPTYYSVFATLTGRPASRAASSSIVLLPPVSNLTADVGPDEITLHWSTHPSVQQVEVTCIGPGQATTRLTPADNSCHLTGLAEGQPLHFAVIAVYPGSDGGLLRSAPARINATPRSKARPIGKLRARPITADGDVCVRVSWTSVDNSEVRVRYSPTPSPWTAGTWVSMEELSTFGADVMGRRTTSRSEMAIEAVLPPGVHHVVPFSIGGTGIVVGAPTTVGVTEPVTRLTATTFADHATLSWEWPPSSHLAEVRWDIGEAADVFLVNKAQYQATGARVPLGRRPCCVEVRALIHAHGSSFASPSVTMTIDAVADIQITYFVRAAPSLGPFGGRAKRVTFSSTEACRGVHVRMVASPGSVMPTSPDEGLTLLDTALDLSPGSPVTHSVTVPRAMTRPYWLRCFVVGGRGRIVDPPVTDLKET